MTYVPRRMPPIKSPAGFVADGAKSFGLKLDVDPDGDLVFSANYEPPTSTLEKIAAHEAELVATLKSRRETIAALWPQLRELDAQQYEAFRNAKIEEIEILQSAFDAMEAAAAVVLPAIRKARTWGEAVRALLNEPYNQKYARRRPAGYSDEQWLSALDKARRLELKGPRELKKVASC